MRKFEYRVRELISIEELNKNGEEGWELVCVVNNDKCFFKREIQ